ncbi:MAG TPA: S8 family serine peptidase, partial [Nitrospiria bacterium]|nr:S8 family serine peptidase [Nitrospiria bacterium]
PSNPGNGGGGGGGGSDQTTPSGVARIGAVGLAVTGAGVGVAVVDTGLDFAHADLNVAAECFTAYSSCQDDQGHGTHVGGIIGALDNTIDVVGVAPSVTLYSVKVLNQNGSGYDSDIMAGLDWIGVNAAAVNPPIHVANLSLGRSGSLNDNPALRASFQALHFAGISVVVAAGNDSGSEVSQRFPPPIPR